MLTLITLKNSICAHLVLLYNCLVAKLLASGENTKNHILRVEKRYLHLSCSVGPNLRVRMQLWLFIQASTSW
jgi:hypothetical protein